MKTLILKIKNTDLTTLAVYAFAAFAGLAIVLFIVNAVINGIHTTATI